MDIEHNLNTARSQIADKMQSVQPFFLKKWMVTLASLLHSNDWAWLIIVVLFISCGCFVLFYISKQVLVRQTALISCILLFSAASVAVALGYKAHQLENKKEAIVFASTINVKSEPTNSATILFVVHEGLKIEVLQQEDDWIRARFEDGNTGWLPSQSIELI